MASLRLVVVGDDFVYFYNVTTFLVEQVLQFLHTSRYNRASMIKKYMLSNLSTLLITLICLSQGGHLYGLTIDKNHPLMTTSRAFQSIASSRSPAIVSISTYKTQSSRYHYYPYMDFLEVDNHTQPRKSGLGSGVIISEDGYIVTSYHIIKDIDESIITLSDGREFKAKIIGTDPKTDLALLKINTTNLPTLPFSNSDTLTVGEWAIAIGNPFGLAGTVTVGIISAKGRSDTEIVDYTSLIQTDAAINPGNSGGALLNIEGDLIGINAAIYTKSGGYMGIGFAVPANTVKRVTEELKISGKVQRGWLGVTIINISKEDQEANQLPNTHGAKVQDIYPESPAEKGGLQAGDIITKINHIPIRSAQTLRTQIAETLINETLQFSILRKGKKTTKHITITPRQKPKEPTIGLALEQATSQQAKRRNQWFEPGLWVTQVTPDSPADQAGLRENDLIIKVNNRYIETQEEFASQLKQPDNSLLVTLKRQGQPFFTVIQKDNHLDPIPR